MIDGAHRPNAERSQPLARPTINARIHKIRRIFRWAVSREMLPKGKGGPLLHELDTVEGLKAGHCKAREPEPVRPVSEADMEATQAKCPSPVDDMIMVQYLTGCRSGGLCSMRWGQIDRSGKVWTYRPARHKTAHRGHQRTIWLGPRCQTILQKYLKANSEAYVFSPRAAAEARWAERRANRKTPMTPSQQGRKRKARPRWQPADRYTPGTYGQAVARAAISAGVVRWSPHQLRHARATLLRRTHGVDAAKVILGHASLDATAIYAEADLQKAEAVMRAIG